MTTIAYRFGLMAADSCLTEGDEHNTRYVGHVDKIFRLKDGSLFGGSGDAECQAIINILQSRAPDEKKAGLLAQVDCECECLLVRPDGRMFWIATDTDYGEFTEFRDEFAAVGSGKDWAYGAMEVRPDVTALEAVQAASRRHAFSRAPFMTMELNPGGAYHGQGKARIGGAVRRAAKQAG